MTRKSFTAPILAAAITFSAATMLAQGYPQQQQGYPQQQQGNYPQQQQGYPQQGQPYPQQGQPPYGDRDRRDDRDRNGWDAPPDEFRSDAQRQGFRDGLMGARQDFESRRQPNASARPEYRHPSVPRVARNDYRQGFSRGYDMATHHMMDRHDDDRRDGDRRDGYQPR